MSRLQVAIDRGGTFTDVVARTADGQIVTMKLLSEDPGKYKDAPTEAIRRLLKQVRFCSKMKRHLKNKFNYLGVISIESNRSRLDSNGYNSCNQCST